MDLLYVFLIIVVIPFVGILLGNLIIDEWDSIVRFIKGISSCFGQIMVVLIAIIVLALVSNWLFKDCTPEDPEVIYHDYDPELHRKY